MEKNIKNGHYMLEWEIELNKITAMLKIRLEMLKESGLTYISKSSAEIVISPDKELKSLKNILIDCKRCKLCEQRTQIVFGTGNAKASLVFVGEGPGADEDAQGEPFVGRAGQLLTKMINAMGLSRAEVYICNVVKCRPPNNRDPEADEIAACEPFLKQQLDIIKPRIIVGLGRYACQTLLKTNTPMSKIRGQWQHYEGIKFMPTFHPAYLLRNPPAKKEVWEDLQAVMRELES
jgi:DNA polymerase